MSVETAATTIPSGAIEIDGKPYMRNAKGALMPAELVKAADKLEDETVRKVLAFALDLSAQIARFKAHTFADLNAFQSLLEQEYGARAGGEKGNVTFQSYDGLMKVQVQIADLIEFGPQLQEAKKLIDECLVEWGAESRPEIRAIVTQAFNVEKAGQINKAELFSLLRMDIADERWKRGMDAIRDAIRVTGTKEYVRFYRRSNPQGKFVAVPIDLAAA
ncbi:DUF3164 family protein [Bosea sp. 2KB_26]|uniref:DUF3164 family protein n=1 Tax=Bosea sp. 2KB_26 TaxID=3237475 RepID=UPI003F90173A